MADSASAAFRFEVPAVLAADSVRNFKSKSGTRIINLLVPLCFRSSCQWLPRWLTNFGSGALELFFERLQQRDGRSRWRRRPVLDDPGGPYLRGSAGTPGCGGTR